jgi:hypothetical protein
MVLPENQQPTPSDPGDASQMPTTPGLVPPPKRAVVPPTPDRSDHRSGHPSPMSSSVSSQSSTLVSSPNSASTSATSGASIPAPPTPGLSAHHPIPPASEPKQFRAIGLIQATYHPSEESFTRGFLKTMDGHSVDAVLLGRVMSLVKKHLDLEQPHLWVVYPRTREKQHELHVQIVGVWEPETLAQSPDGEDTAPSEADAIAPSEADPVDEPAEVPQEADLPAAVEEAASPPEAEEPSPLLSKPKLMAPVRPPEPPAPTLTPPPEPAAPAIEPQDGYFSVRGEIIGVSEEHQQITVRIQQAPRKAGAEAKAFRLILSGILEGKLVGHFWDLHARRQKDQLMIESATRIGIAPPRHKPKTKAPKKKKKKQNIVKVKRKDQRSPETPEVATETTTPVETPSPAEAAPVADQSAAPDVVPTEAAPEATPAIDTASMPPEAPALEPEAAEPEAAEPEAVAEQPASDETVAPEVDAAVAPDPDPKDEA